jgi:hypothetical protein
MYREVGLLLDKASLVQISLDKVDKFVNKHIII